jgi:hypothetical protein
MLEERALCLQSRRCRALGSDREHHRDLQDVRARAFCLSDGCADQNYQRPPHHRIAELATWAYVASIPEPTENPDHDDVSTFDLLPSIIPAP